MSPGVLIPRSNGTALMQHYKAAVQATRRASTNGTRRRHRAPKPLTTGYKNAVKVSPEQGQGEGQQKIAGLWWAGEAVESKSTGRRPQHLNTVRPGTYALPCPQSLPQPQYSQQSHVLRCLLPAIRIQVTPVLILGDQIFPDKHLQAL